MKKTYINPAMVVVPFIATQVIANSLNGLTGLDDVSMGEGDFTGGASDVKGFDNKSIWDDEW